MSDAPAAQLVALSPLVSAPAVALAGFEVTIGRADHCTVVVARPLASRLHARLAPSDGRYLLADAGSLNGTFLNGHRISEPQLLRPGDTIGIAAPDAILRFEDSDGTRARAEPLRFDLEQQRFFFHDRALSLSQQEFKLLLHLRSNAGRPCAREACVYAVWHTRQGVEAYRASLDQLIYQIRQKLQLIDHRADLIKTVRSEGYMLQA